MGRFKWSREDAQAYLAANPDFKPAKPLDSYSTSELKRKASYYKKAEQEGFKPSVSGSRGHAEVRHIPRFQPSREQMARRKGLRPRPEQYAIGSQGRRASMKDLDRVIKYAQKPPKPKKGQALRSAVTFKGAGGGMVSGNVSGILAEPYGQKTAGEDATISFRISMNNLRLIQAESKDLTDVANKLAESQGFKAIFEYVYSISIVDNKKEDAS